MIAARLATGAWLQVEKKMFFFEKKNQKTFVHIIRLLHIAYSRNHKFFASFLKRSIFYVK